MINTTLCYSATSGSSVADYDKLRRVDMGNVGYIVSTTSLTMPMNWNTGIAAMGVLS